MEYTYNPSASSQQLKIRSFRFFNDYDVVYFHCELLACYKGSSNSIVNPLCYTEEEAVLNRGGYLVEVFSGPSWLYPFGADSLSRSVHCAPDENDRPSERTKIF